MKDAARLLSCARLINFVRGGGGGDVSYVHFCLMIHLDNKLKKDNFITKALEQPAPNRFYLFLLRFFFAIGFETTKSASIYTWEYSNQSLSRQTVEQSARKSTVCLFSGHRVVSEK